MNKWVNRKLDKKRTTGKGFTLIELIVVVTVLGILAAIVIYAVGNISGSATKAASGTTTSEVTQAEQAYCQANGVYGDVDQLVAGGYLTNPNPSLSIYTNTVPSNGQLFNACGTSVYDAFPQTIMQPDGSTAVIPVPPTTILTVDGQGGTPMELLAVLGLTPYGGVAVPETGGHAAAFGPIGFTSLITQNNYVNMGTGNSTANLQAMAASHPQLIYGVGGTQNTTTVQKNYEAIAPFLSINTANQIAAPSNPQPLDLSLFAWLPDLVELASVTNTQVQAASYITAFQNEAANIETQLAGKTVSIIEAADANDIQFRGLGGVANAGSELLEYLGMNLICPNCAVPANNNQYTMSSELASPTTVTAQYLVVLGVNDSNLAIAETMFGNPGTTTGGTVTTTQLPQIAAGGMWGPNDDGAYGDGTVSTATWTPTIPAPLTDYCSIAGVSTVVAVVPTQQTGTYCPGYGSTTTGGVTTYFTPTATGLTSPPPQYTAQQLTAGITPNGPLTEFVAMQYVPAAFPSGA